MVRRSGGRGSGRARGYTITELMVVVAITSIVSSVAYLVISRTIRAQMMADSLTTIQQGAFTTFDTISKVLRQADSSTVVIDRYDAYQPPWSRITFSKPNGGQSYSFYQKGQTFYIGSVPSLQNLRLLTFSYPNSGDDTIISVSMTFEKYTGSGQSKAIQLFIQKVRIQN